MCIHQSRSRELEYYAAPSSLLSNFYWTFTTQSNLFNSKVLLWCSFHGWFCACMKKVILTHDKCLFVLLILWCNYEIWNSSGNFSVEAKIYERQFKRHQENQVAVVREVLKDASRATWRCDPEHHIEGRTYGQVTRLLQVSCHSTLYFTSNLFKIDHNI